MELDKNELKNSTGNIYVQVFFDTSCSATTDVWTGDFETKENFEAGLALVVQNIKKFQAKKWLADLSNMQGSFEPARDFILKSVIPEAINHGLRYEALVLPDNIFAMLSVQDAMEKIDNDFSIRLFGSITEAREWLNSRP